MTASDSNRLPAAAPRTTRRPASSPVPAPAHGTAGRITRVDDATRLEAVDRLLSGGGSDGPARPAARRGLEGSSIASVAHAERFIAFTSANGIRIDAMWTLRGDDDRIAATVLAVPNPGRTAILFTSAPEGRAGTAALSTLIDHACGELSTMDVDLAQVLLDPRHLLQRDALLAAGFSQLARLNYMERTLGGRRRPATPAWPEGVTVEPYDDSKRAEILEVLEASYEDTLDCPGLRGLRRTEDILEGHRGTGEYDPTLWTLLRIGGEPRGALLLSRSPTSETIELVYIGLARCARGRGLGRELLRHGLHLLAGRSERSMTLAVDEVNRPAIALYRGEGFRAVLARIALIRSLRVRA